MSNAATQLIPSNCDNRVFIVPCQITVWIWRLCPISLLIVGTVGNALNVLVFTRRQMRKNPTTLYLLFLAISDTVFLWCNVLQYAFLIFKSSDVKNVSIFNCLFHDWLLFVSSGFSIYLLLLLTAERVIHTKWPIFARGKLTKRLALILIITMLVVHMFVCGPLLFGYHYGKVQNNRTEQLHQNGSVTIIIENSEAEKCTMLETFVDFRNKSWRYFILLCLNLLPMLVLIIGNSLIVSTLKAQKRRIQPSSSEQQEGVTRNNDKRRNSATKMLYILTAFFFVTITPFCIFSLLLNYMVVVPGSLQFSIVQLVHSITANLVLCNFTCNFFLYSISGSMFKKEWKKMVTSYKFNCFNVYRRVRGLDPLERATIEDVTRATRVTEF